MNNDEKKSSLSILPLSSERKEGKSLFSDDEHDYGMPNFAFPDDDSPAPFLKEDDPRDTIAEVEASLNLPISEGTGWESGDAVKLAPFSDAADTFSDHKPGSELGPVTEQEVKPELELDLETQLKAEMGLKPEADLESEFGFKLETDLETETGLKPETDPEPEMGFKPETDFETDMDLKFETDLEPETGLKPQTDPEPETELKPETDSKTEISLKPETDSELELRLKPETGSEAEMGLKSETDFGAETGLNPDADFEPDLGPEPEFETLIDAFDEEPSQANVMPFPGNTILRPSELEPSELLRGAEDTPVDDLLDSPALPYSGPAEDYDADEPDSIASAVQSALKNVYGSEAEAPAEESSAPDFRQFSVAESLRQDAAAQAATQGAYWDDEELEHEHGHPEQESETVLDYLYSNRRAGPERLQEPHTPPEDYSAYGATDLDRGAVYYHPEHDGRQGDYDDYEDDPEWSPPSFVTSSAPIQSPGHYPAPMTTAANPESLAVGTPDSSHLLGAAGLGLIGGIALAGVLAVFVVNSFVEENAVPPVSTTLATPKVVERLGSESNLDTTIITSRGTTETTIPGPNIQPAQQAARSAAIQPSEPIETPAPAITPPAPDKPLNAFDVAGLPGAEIPLKIKMSEEASKEAALISLKGLNENSKLSTGIDVGAGQWLLPPARLDALTVTAPETVSGTFDIEVQLLKDDAQTPISDPVSFTLTISREAKLAELAPSTDTPISALNETNDEATQLVEVTESTPEIDTDPLTQLLIRDGNKLMREGDILGARRLYEQAAANGNPEAALAMGRSYDPSYFEKLPVQTGKPDPAAAFQWYKQALDGGLVTARVKIDGLKQWLQQ